MEDFAIEVMLSAIYGALSNSFCGKTNGMPINYRLVDRISESGLLLCKFLGALSFEALHPLLDELQQIEAQHPQGFNRYSDLSGIDSISLGTNDIRRIAERRKQDYQGAKVLSAIYTADQLAFGMARIYGSMMYPSPIEVSVFYTDFESAEWLKVPIAELKLLGFA